MTARTRSILLVSAFSCLTILVALSMMVRLGWQPLRELDTALGGGAQNWTHQRPLVVDALRVVEFAFNRIPVTVATAVTAAALFVRGRRRAAYWTVGVMIGASVTTYLLKQYFQESRPVWRDPISTLTSFAFPSGHASNIASATGVAVVLALLLVRRPGVRRVVVGTAVLLFLLVGADRILLGVHHLSDVIAGYSVGLLWVLGGLVVYHPAPPGRALEPLSSALPTTKQLAVVLNPVKVGDLTGFRSLVETMAADSGWSRPSWHLTTVHDAGKSMAEAAAISGADLVLVCGGDGTVRTVCAELAGTGIPVGVVPTGTGNLLARNLGIPLLLRAAIDVALNGQDQAIDLVSVYGDGLDDEHFLVMAGMGFDAAIMEGATEQIKARVGWLAYVVAGLRNLAFPAVRVEVSVDDGPCTRHWARTVVIGNVGYLQAGIPLLPDATIDDGVIDVVVVSPARFLSWVPVAFRVMSRNKRTDAALTRMTGRKVVIRAAHDTPRQLDGDPVGMGKELRAECIHGRLLVRVPR